jgi:hypothetical protein
MSEQVDAGEGAAGRRARGQMPGEGSTQQETSEAHAAPGNKRGWAHPPSRHGTSQAGSTGAGLAGFDGLELAMISAAVGWVAIHSHLLAGRGLAAYQTHAAIAIPIVSLIAGLPAFWGAGRDPPRPSWAGCPAHGAGASRDLRGLGRLLIIVTTQDQRYNWSMTVLSYPPSASRSTGVRVAARRVERAARTEA